MAAAFFEDHALLVILGHYGSGKTNLALNIAVKLRKLGRCPLLVDLDIVNPYFRTTDYQELALHEDIKILGPALGNSNLEAPSLAPGVDAALRHASLEQPVIVDVGGDPDGARALARFAPTINGVANKIVIAVVNAKRPETQTLRENLRMLGELSDISALSIDGLVGNTHLAEFTTHKTAQDSLPLLEELAHESGIPLLAVTVPASLTSQEGDCLQGESALPVERLVTTPWQ